MARIKHKSIDYLIYGHLSFYFFILLSILLVPSGVLTNNGLSYYGTLRLTLPLFALAFLSASFFIVLAISILPKGSRLFQTFQTFLFILICLLLAVMATPYSLSPFFYKVHKIFAWALFMTQGCMGVWLTIYTYERKRDVFWLLVKGFALGIGFLSISHIVPLLIGGQLLYEIAFAFILIRSLDRLLEREGDLVANADSVL
jgi:hypothetical protein